MQDGDTPLNCASFNGHVTVVRLLLERKAGVNICNNVSCCEEVAKYYCVRTEHFISTMLLPLLLLFLCKCSVYYHYYCIGVGSTGALGAIAPL